ncbi:enoyl-CoA hydratase [Corynebacterium falsenii DSM 44353]|uniref:enoyl-CoA hydratase n=1 Tax=Corynebacterium falsenii TaxID=108486 RepID=UPI0003E94885|nr:enoyl-CoA hydratase [Corynebacterium falsenii]AHI02634.1 enoyl-CoA hydratase [Corynebacterium falsenii DSM 44353]UBI05420.1 enoyl-CoA hydratase [Corynebacterium falsenii]
MGVDVFREGSVGVVVLNHPEKRNAIRAEVATAVTRGIHSLLDQQVRAILIRGEGPAFCAGADLSGGVYGDDFWPAMRDMLHAILDAPVPVIADVQGPAVGAGCQILLACELRVFGPDALVWVPLAQHGFALDFWTHERARELMGGAMARNVFLAGVKVDAQQAAAIGFATLIGDATTALDFATTVAAQAPLSMEHSKRVFNSPDLSQQPELEAQIPGIWASEDAAEARRARSEKRAPQFHGR